MREIKFRAWLDSCKTMLYGITVYPDMIGISVDEFEKHLGYFESGYEYDGEDVVTTDGEFNKVMTTLSGDDWVFIEPKNYIVEQFTGLKDKNGKEIYEGDIVRYTSATKYDPLNNRMVYVGQIQNWVGQMGVGFRYKSGRHTMMLKLGHSFNMEVIGNIHENADLS